MFQPIECVSFELRHFGSFPILTQATLSITRFEREDFGKTFLAMRLGF